MINCNNCSNQLIKKVIIKPNNIGFCKGCRSSFNNISCTCDKDKEDIIIDEYWCEKCNIKLYECEKCNNYYDKLINNICTKCIENIKNNNPSNNEFIYEFNNTRWYLIKQQLICKICNDEKYFKTNHTHIRNIGYIQYICINCKIHNLKSKYKNYEFKIEEDETSNHTYFRKLCICQNITEWIRLDYILNKDFILQCKKCNPSNNFKKYRYDKYDNHWHKIGHKCNLCDNIMYSYSVDCDDVDIIQCEECKPPNNNNIKFKFIDYGYKIDKIRKYNGTRHYWTKPNYSDINYKCECTKCAN